MLAEVDQLKAAVDENDCHLSPTPLSRTEPPDCPVDVAGFDHCKVRIHDSRVTYCCDIRN
jgi:hypothetical protein